MKVLTTLSCPCNLQAAATINPNSIQLDQSKIEKRHDQTLQ